LNLSLHHLWPTTSSWTNRQLCWCVRSNQWRRGWRHHLRHRGRSHRNENDVSWLIGFWTVMQLRRGYGWINLQSLIRCAHPRLRFRDILVEAYRCCLAWIWKGSSRLRLVYNVPSTVDVITTWEVGVREGHNNTSHIRRHVSRGARVGGIFDRLGEF
jgi:hypothetical protein